MSFTQYEKDHILSAKKEIERIVLTKVISKTSSSVIAGGVFASLLRGEDYKDIDVFVFNDLMSYVLSKNCLKQTNSDYLKSKNKSITDVYLDDIQKINTIFTIYKTRNELLCDFDYLHCCVSYDFEKLHISPAAYKAIINRKLIINNPANIALYREQKFLKQGYTK